MYILKLYIDFFIADDTRYFVHIVCLMFIYYIIVRVFKIRETKTVVYYAHVRT